MPSNNEENTMISQKEISVEELIDVYHQLDEEHKQLISNQLSDEDYAAELDENGVIPFNFLGFDDNTNVIIEQSESNKDYKVTIRQQKFLDTVSRVKEICANEAKTIAYYPPYLSKTTLPYQKTEDYSFKRSNGDLEMSIVANPDWGLPYGIVARRLLIHFATYAVRNKSQAIPVKSINMLAKDIGMAGSGRNYKLIHDMLKRLAGSTLYIKGRDKKGEELSINKCGLIESIEISKDANPSNPNLILLDRKFFEMCTKSSGPIDSRVASELKSPISFDVYVFLLARLLTVKKPTRIKWEDFMGQFGSQNKDFQSTKQHLKTSIDKVLIIQPNMRVSYDDKVVILRPSISAIKTRKGRIRRPESDADE